MKSNTKAQGAIEYLLIIGAAILVVAIVTGILIVAVSQGQTQTTEGTSRAYDSLHDLAVSGMGYVISVEARDTSSHGYNPPKSQIELDSYCTAVSGNYCSWPIKNAATVFGAGYDGCLDVPAVIDIEIKDLTTGEIYKETLNVTGTFSTKTFVINYTGNPNHKHNVRAYFTDCCKSINKTTGERGCNSDKGGGVLYSPEYGFDKNMEVLKIIVKNSDGKEIGTQRVTGCASSAPSSPCYDLNFS